MDYYSIAGPPSEWMVGYLQKGGAIRFTETEDSPEQLAKRRLDFKKHVRESLIGGATANRQTQGHRHVNQQRDLREVPVDVYHLDEERSGDFKIDSLGNVVLSFEDSSYEML